MIERTSERPSILCIEFIFILPNFDLEYLRHLSSYPCGFWGGSPCILPLPTFDIPIFSVQGFAGNATSGRRRSRLRIYRSPNLPACRSAPLDTIGLKLGEEVQLGVVYLLLKQEVNRSRRPRDITLVVHAYRRCRVKMPGHADSAIIQIGKLIVG